MKSNFTAAYLIICQLFGGIAIQAHAEDAPQRVYRVGDEDRAQARNQRQAALRAVGAAGLAVGAVKLRDISATTSYNVVPFTRTPEMGLRSIGENASLTIAGAFRDRMEVFDRGYVNILTTDGSSYTFDSRTFMPTSDPAIRQHHLLLEIEKIEGSGKVIQRAIVDRRPPSPTLNAALTATAYVSTAIAVASLADLARSTYIRSQLPADEEEPICTRGNENPATQCLRTPLLKRMVGGPEYHAPEQAAAPAGPQVTAQ